MFHSFDPRRSFKFAALVAFFALSLVLVSPVVQASGRHDVLLKKRHSTNRLDALEKRQGGSRFTYFKTGLGACGGQNVDSDYVVAINTPQWDGGSHCGEPVTITIGGKQATATVVDRCVECPYGALDFTIGLFKHFDSNLGTGTLYGSWSFGNAAPEPKPTTSKPTPKPTPTPTPTPEPTTSSTSETRETSKTSSSTTTSSVESTMSAQASSTASSAAAESSAAPALPPSGVLEQVGRVMIEMAMLATTH